MKDVIPLSHRSVLWGAAIGACLLSAFVLPRDGRPVLALKNGQGRFLATTAGTGGRTDLSSRSAAVLKDSAGSGTTQTTKPRLVEPYVRLPLSFEINRGQTDSRVKFLSRGSGYSLFLTRNEAVLTLRKLPVITHQRSAAHRGRASLGSGVLIPKSATHPAFFRTPVTEWTHESAAFTPTKGETRTTDALLRMKLVGANLHAKVSGLEQLPGKSNYFIGNDPKKWRSNVPNYAKVKYSDVYPGADLVYYGNQGKLEYDFVVRPGANPNRIVLDVRAGLAPPERAPQAALLHVNATGDLVVGSEAGEVIFHKPIVYQPATNHGQRTTGKHFVDGKYAVKGNRITFELASYDKAKPLVIDPVLTYSTYLGGSGGDVGGGIAVDASGSAYVTGYTGSSDFPTTAGAFQTTLRSACCSNAFVSKLNAAGSALAYSTYLGGSGFDQGTGITVDASGNAYVAGWTGSSDFPTTSGAFQTTFGGQGDAFVSKLNATGSALLYSTYLGGSGFEGGNYFGIAIDGSLNAYVTGDTGSSDFPTTPGALQTTFVGGGECGCDAFVSKLSAAGSALLYSTYLGGSDSDEGTGIAVDTSGNAYVSGHTLSLDFPTTSGAFQTTHRAFDDAFVSKLNSAGSALLYSTYLGGSNGSGSDFNFARYAIAIDSATNAYITGHTSASDFPTTPGAFQTTFEGGSCTFVPCLAAFVSKLNAAGSALVYSTYLGGNDFGGAIAVDPSGSTYVTGRVFSASLPTTSDAFQTAYGGGYDAFVSKLNAAGSALVYSTYLGGSSTEDQSGAGIAVDTSGNAYVTGETFSSDFPVTPGAFQTTLGGADDAFVAKISFAAGDTTAPATTASLGGLKGEHGWYRGPVTITLSATDPDSAVAATYYSVDGRAHQTYSAPFSIAADGVHQLSFYSVDPAGNQEKAHQLTINIDATPPTVTVAVHPTTLWPPSREMVKVSISGTITDATSRVNPSSLSFTVWDEYGAIEPTGPLTLGGNGSYSFGVLLQAWRRGTDLDGRLYTATVSAEDNAGNTASGSSGIVVPHDQGR